MPNRNAGEALMSGTGCIAQPQTALASRTGPPGSGVQSGSRTAAWQQAHMRTNTLTHSSLSSNPTTTSRHGQAHARGQSHMSLAGWLGRLPHLPPWRPRSATKHQNTAATETTRQRGGLRFGQEFSSVLNSAPGETRNTPRDSTESLETTASLQHSQGQRAEGSHRGPRDARLRTATRGQRTRGGLWGSPRDPEDSGRTLTKYVS